MADRTNWRSIDVTSKAGASPAPGSRLAAWSIAPSITPELYFIDADKHHVCEISYTGTSWVFNDVTSAAGAPSPATGSPLAATEITAAGVPGSDYLPEVYYVDVNNHVCQLAWTGSYWQFNDLTSKAGAAPPATDSPLAATFIGTPQGGPSFMPEVYFIDVNNHVREISWTGSNWLTSDVTSAAGAPLPAPGSPLAATENNDPRATQDIALPEVYYTDTNNHIWQAAWTGSEWQANDVTSAARAPLPASGSPLTPASITTSTGFLPDVYFLDANQHVCQLAWTGTEC